MELESLFAVLMDKGARHARPAERRSRQGREDLGPADGEGVATLFARLTGRNVSPEEMAEFADELAALEN